jgi:hypothetical protein
MFDISYNFKLKPSLLVKCSNGAPYKSIYPANMMYNDKFVLGLALQMGYC